MNSVAILAQAILAQAISCSKSTLLLRVVRLWCIFFLSLAPRVVMPRGWYQTPSGWWRSLRRVIVRVPEHVVQPSRIVSLGHRRAVVQWSDVGVRLLARAVSGSRSLDSTQTSFFRKPGQGWPSWRWRTGSRQPPVSSNEPSAELATTKQTFFAWWNSWRKPNRKKNKRVSICTMEKTVCAS